MSDSLRASMERLVQSTTELNEATDEAARVVLATESFLAKECSVGIESFVEVSSEYVNDYDAGRTMTIITTLCYERYGDRFRITVFHGDGTEDNSVRKPWSEWDRTTKLETVRFLPELIESIANAADHRVSKAREATEKVASVLEVLKPKSAPVMIADLMEFPGQVKPKGGKK